MRIIYRVKIGCFRGECQFWKNQKNITIQLISDKQHKMVIFFPKPQLAACCSGRGPNEAELRQAGIGQPL